MDRMAEALARRGQVADREAAGSHHLCCCGMEEDQQEACTLRFASCPSDLAVVLLAEVRTREEPRSRKMAAVFGMG